MICSRYLELVKRLFEKRADFNFPIVNFPYMSSNVPSAPAYGVYEFQLVWYAEPVANIKTLLIEGSCSPINCYHRVIAKRSLCHQLKSSRDIMASLNPTMLLFLNLFQI